MSQLPQTSPPTMGAATFGSSADGMFVALVGENAYAMVPAAEGKHYLASGWRIARPMAEWTRAEGVTAHSTAQHGGFKLSAERNRQVHPMLRARGDGTKRMSVGRSLPSLFRTSLPRLSAAMRIGSSRTRGPTLGKQSQGPNSVQESPG